MTSRNKRRWLIIKEFALGWTLAFIFLSIVRGEGTQEIGSVDFEMWRALMVSVIAGPLFGSISGFAQIVTEERGYKQISLQKLLVLRVAFAILFLASMIGLAYLFFGKDISFLEFAFEPGSFAIYLYMLTVDAFMFGLRQVNLFLGTNNLWKLFSGQYYNPREEERIFMFLDLKSSTTHAERLGHITYSKMIQDCFNDLGVVVDHQADIYQYVGDEVILTWKLAEGLKQDNCLNAFYAFKTQLEQRSAHYSQAYNCKPHFKAGMNAGVVTVTEVGKYKKEIAYHGDTINTAARIQGMCNALDQEFLISENLKNLMDNSHFVFNQLGSIELKGKREQVALFGVTQTD